MNETVERILGQPEIVALLDSSIPARLAFVGHDGGPRVQPIWFHWNGRTFIMSTGPTTPKARAIRRDPRVAFTIDSEAGPYHSLQIRGLARLEIVPGVPREYELAAARYYGDAVGARWIQSVLERRTESARIEIEPTWAFFMDVRKSFPADFD